MGGAELADDFGGVAVLGVDEVVHGLDFFGGELAGEVVDGELDLGVGAEGIFANEGDGLVGREVVEVVGEDGEVEGSMGPSVELPATMSTWLAARAR